MAILSRGQTLGATETVTNTKLHNLVDLGSVTAIVNADIDSSANIADTKIADITTGGKVRGTSILNLPSIPSGAGLIPSANIPVIGSTHVSLVSIPNSSLLPITLTSWIDGSAMRNIQSMPSLAGQLSWYSIVSSLASGGTIRFNGSNNFVGSVGNTGYTLVSTTSVSAAAKSAAINVTNTKQYLIVIDITAASTSGTYYGIELNGDTANNVQYIYSGGSTAAAIARATGTTAFCYLTNTTSSGNASGTRFGSIINLFPQSTGTTERVYFSGKSTYINNVNEIEYLDFAAQYSNGTTDLTSFKIIIGSGNFTGTIYLYELISA